MFRQLAVCISFTPEVERPMWQTGQPPEPDASAAEV